MPFENVRQTCPQEVERPRAAVAAVEADDLVFGQVGPVELDGRDSLQVQHQRRGDGGGVGVGAAVAGVALLAATVLPVGWLSLALLVVAGGGLGAAQGVFWTVPAALGIGNGRVPVGVIAFISMFGTAGGILGPTLIGWVRESTGSFMPAIAALAALLILACVVIAPSLWRRRLEPARGS